MPVGGLSASHLPWRRRIGDRIEAPSQVGDLGAQPLDLARSVCRARQQLGQAPAIGFARVEPGLQIGNMSHQARDLARRSGAVSDVGLSVLSL